jgi:hypothetical protein
LESAQIYLEWRQQHLPKQWRSQLERKIKDTDRFVPHDLAPDLVDDIRAVLVNHHEIDSAYLVRKPMELFPESSIYILAIKLAKTKSSNGLEEQWERELCDRLSIEINLSKRSIIAIFDRHKSLSIHPRDLKLISKIERVPGGCIL